MSKEYLTNVLDKFAQVTTILVETSKIKEFIDDKILTNKDLKLVLERTKSQVDNLCDHSKSIKELFYKDYDKLLTESSSVNGHASEKELETTTDENDTNCNQLKEKSAPKKPLITLVDIKKLVEPSALIEQNKNNSVNSTMGKKNLSVDSVVVITSSDDDMPKPRTKVSPKGPKEKRARPTRKAALKTITKTRKVLQGNSSSDSDLTDDEKDKEKDNNKSNDKKQSKNLDKVSLSDTSTDLSDDTLNSKEINSSEGNKKKKTTKEVSKKDLDNYDSKKDPKFISKCYVDLVRVPCEKLEEYYLNKQELLEIKKLSNLSSLKRKKGKKSDSDVSDNASTQKKKKKAKAANKTGLTENNSSSSGDGTDKEQTIDLDEPISITNDPSGDNNEVSEAADLAMSILCSDDKEHDNKDSDAHHENEDKNKTPESLENREGPPSDTEKGKELASENNGEKEKTAVGKNEKEKNSKEKESSESLTSKTKNKNQENEETSDKDEDEGKKKGKSDNKKEDKSKKAWKKDKLLTEKLSSSDSEEEFQKFCKKKSKMTEEVMSDDEEVIKAPRNKKNRIMKKRMKKSVIISDSDSDKKKDSSDEFEKPSSSSSSSESEKENEKKVEEKKASRKRVKRVKESSDENEDEKSTRKQIRNIWSRDSLAETTKKAEAEERERKARILERQRKYNQIFDNTYEKNATVDKVVLDFDEKKNKELLKVDQELVNKLKPHQASGIQFMWDACFESLERANSTTGSGCILAHCMGLGKTLQVIALAHTLLINNEKTKVRKVLVVCPLNTVLNWVSEFRQWLPDLDDFEIYELVSFKQNYERVYQVKNWHNHGGVLIMGYDMFRNLSNPDNKRISKKMRTTFQETLVDPGPDLVICDEGHLLKNEKTNLSIAMNRIKTLRRIVLTGTPLQNNLKEYFCMVQFIKPNLLGTYKEYLNRFVNPIINGQYTDSTPHDIQIMRKRSHVLHKMLDGVVQRRDYSVLAPYLPPKHEYVLFLNLTEVQINLYRHYMDNFAKRSTIANRTSFLFVDFQAFQRICTHPRVLLDKSIEMKQAKLDESEDSEGSLKDFINDEEDDASSPSSSSNSNSDEDDEKDDEKKNNKTKTSRSRITRGAVAAAKENGEVIDLQEEVAEKEWWQEYCDGDELNEIKHSSKLFLLFEILKECEQIGDKVLVFSQSLYSLNVIEYFLERIHEATQQGETDSVGGHSGSWCLGLDYFRLDGSSSCDNRSIWCKTFNDPANTRARLFLISTRAGGLGINLVAANRVIIFDVSWNPSHDIQSIYRVYRFGQTKPCYIYRFVTNGTMEMKIYERQVTKQAISKRVIDEQQIDRHYNQNDLAELYKFDPNPGERPIPLVPKDVLLGEMLQKFEDRIYKFHEHQSLLENKEEECLNEEERKAAWEEFENEKKQRQNMGSFNFLRHQNLELALVNMIRRDNPLLSTEEIRAQVPVLQAQIQQNIAEGDLTLYRKMYQELQIIQALQNQKLKQQFYQQQALKLMQQQQIAAALANYQNQYQTMAGPSTSNFITPQTPQNNSNDVIDLND